MKKILVLFSLLIPFAFQANAQQNNHITNDVKLHDSPGANQRKDVNIVVENENVPRYVPKYVLNEKMMPNYFKSGVIPADFPLVDKTLSKKQNAQVAYDWAMQNLNLIKEEYHPKLAELRNKYNLQ